MTVRSTSSSGLSSGRRARIAYLDGIRAVAILAVIGVHWAYPHTGIARGGYVGVDLFFVLSGYIITRIIWSRRESFTYGGFLKQRLRRLYPALIGLVVIAVPLAIAFGGRTPAAGLLAGLLALAQVNSIAMGANLVNPDPFNVTWSLSAEWIFYLLWPLLLMRLARRAPGQAALMTALVAAVLYVASLPTGAMWFYYGPTSRAAQLLAGAALALALEQWQPSASWRTIIRVAVPVLLLGCVAWVFLGPIEYAPLYRLLGFPLATATGLALILEGRAWPEALSTRLLSMRWLAGLGLISYSVYLWHSVPLLAITKEHLHIPLGALAVLDIGIAVAASGLSYALLERRFMRPRSRLIA